ncbi:MAG: hypothetical protein JXR83_18040 [Deltaproteobacteria bacterium]|nr:hypothetical protein [Deltaproteobacteria bacterium]
MQRGDVTAIPESFRPEARRVFALVGRWVEADRVRWTDAGPSARGLSRRFRAHGRVLLLAHPLAAARAPAWFGRAPSGPLLFAAATASTRSVLVWSPDRSWPPFFAKLSLPIEIGGVRRVVEETEAVTCVGLTRLLVPLTAHADHGLRLLPEPLSVVPRDGAPPGGCLVRTVPRAVLEGRTALLPWFALTHSARDGGEALLPAWQRRERVDLLSHVQRALLRPFLRAWMASALEQGWCAEVHAQNLLVELDAAGRLSGRFFVRDIEGVYADLAFIEQTRPRLARRVRSLPCVRNIADDYQQLDLAHGTALSLHTYFASGPIWHLERAAGDWVRRGLIAGSRPRRGAFRRLFHDELAARMRAVSDTPVAAAAVRSATRFADWLLDQRQRRCPRPRIPARLAPWLEIEQTVNERARDPRLFAAIAVPGLPDRIDPLRRPIWQIEYLEIPRTEVVLARCALPCAIRSGLFAGRGDRGRVRFFIHPWAREQHGLDAARYGLQRGDFWATPTASVRSLVVWSRRDPALYFGLKLSLDVEIQRIRRLVKASKLARATALTAVFDAIPAEQRRRHGFDVLREPLTLRLPEQEHGTIVRQLAPHMQRLVPGFALFAERPGRRPPLALALAGPAIDAERLVHWMIEEIWTPLVRVGAHLMFGEGLIGDLHQQNVLFERASDGRLTGRLVLRDLDSFKTDLDLRFRRGRTLRPYADAAGSCADLKLDVGHHWYDEAWANELRAEWVYLATRLCRRWSARLGGRDAVRAALAGRRLWAAFDRLLLTAAGGYLGDAVVCAEIWRALGARRCAGARRAQARLLGAPAAGTGVRAALAELPDELLTDPHEVRRPLYSLNALVRAWNQQAPCPRRGRLNRARQRLLRRRFVELAVCDRTLRALPLPDGATISEHEGVLVAWGAGGAPANYALTDRARR